MHVARDIGVGTRTLHSFDDYNMTRDSAAETFSNNNTHTHTHTHRHKCSLNTQWRLIDEGISELYTLYTPLPSRKEMAL